MIGKVGSVDVRFQELLIGVYGDEVFLKKGLQGGKKSTFAILE